MHYYGKAEEFMAILDKTNNLKDLIDNDDNVWFSEVNFRNSTWSYASTVVGMPLPYLWALAMKEGKIPDKSYKHFDKFEAMVEPIDYGKRVDTIGLHRFGQS